jgi:RHH-type proline utilization regulon transcriptional repressor/proline dehydrogenase/delta 1-pyrroline-5-carboxylate dehydrogenase
MTTSPAATFEGVLPSRLTPADRGQIERRVQEIGRGLLERALAAEPTAASSEWWVQQAAEWATQDDDLKVRLFRLVDCMPMLDDPAALDRHVREYVDDDVIARLPRSLRLAFQAARSGFLAPLAARAIRAATLAQARRFIAGGNPAEAAQAALAQRRHHRGFTLDLLGEAVTSEADADAYAAAYTDLLRELPRIAAGWSADPLVDDGPTGPLPRVNVSLKLSALDSQFDAIDPHGTAARVLTRLRPIWRLARANGAQVHVDMESHATKDLALAIFRAIAMEEEFRDWPHCGIVVQCYLRDSLRDLESLAQWARHRGTPVWIRLVKGAYWDSETVHARAAGWPVPVWQEKWRTDACFEAATTFLLEHADTLRPALGSHNLRSLAHGMAVAEHLGVDRRAVEMQMLHGMGDPEKDAVTAAGWRLRIYMPYGQLVPGMAYLVRRLLENSSNDSFLRAGFVKHVPPATLLAPPRPAAAVVAPAADGDGGFANEPLADFALESSRGAFAEAIDRAAAAFARGTTRPTWNGTWPRCRRPPRRTRSAPSTCAGVRRRHGPRRAGTAGPTSWIAPPRSCGGGVGSSRRSRCSRWASRGGRPTPTWPRRSTSAGITPRRPACWRRRAASTCRARRTRPRGCRAARASSSRRGISRWRSSPA